MQSFWQDLGYGACRLAQSRTITLAAILMLDVGMSASAAQLLAPAGGQVRFPTKEWPASAPEASGLDSGHLAAFAGDIAGGKFQFVDSLLVIRRGSVVLDRSFTHDYRRAYGERARAAGPLNHDPKGPYNYF